MTVGPPSGLAYRRAASGAAVLLALLALLGMVVGCGGGGEESRAFRNPIWRQNFRDPFVLRVDDTYYAYGTKDAQSTRSGITRDVYPANIQVLTSEDLVRWKRSRNDALPKVPPWAYPQLTWAPEVLDAGDGRFVLYYTALAKNEGKQCIGAAYGDSPAGPFTDRADEPFVCQTKEGGSIDPDPFRDEDGKTYLLWKNDGNCCGLDTWLYAQRLSADGRRLVGRPARLVKQDAPWEASTVEAPTMWREHGRLYLFFSANDFQSDLYSVGYATCRTPLGPCTDSRRNPILKSRCNASGPGHQSIVRDGDGRTWIVYHAFWAHPKPRQIDITVMWLDRVAWRHGRPVVHGPTCRPQPVP